MTPGPEAAAERLRDICTWPHLLGYFIDELGWPLGDESLVEDDDLEDITYDWDLTDLGIRDPNPPIERVRQLRPFTPDQPWGIFFIEMTGRRLLRGKLRQILARLVERKRALRTGDLRSWDLADLLFVVMTGSGDSIDFNLLVFYKDAGKVEFRYLQWGPGSSYRHLRRLSDELLPQMVWPDDETDTAAWRSAWRNPFTLRPGEVIASADRLADRMACTARDLRDQIGEALKCEDDEGPFSELMRDVHEQLVADVDGDRFADMCAQTLVYGLLGSRVSDPDGFGATPVLSVIPLSNPFLSAFFERVYGEAAALDLEGSGLDHLAADLRVTHVEAILDQFGSTVKGGDPVIHFYEVFLKKYDRKIRADAGAFYTPAPVVDFMVRGVDEILRSRFGLEMGIADRDTWAQVAERIGFDVPEEVDSNRPFVSMIDPATGTGTYLVNWLHQAKRSFTEASPDGSWRAHLGDTVLPSMHAFENMLGPYTIAHLKLALHLHDEGLDTEAVQILLTDTLDHDPPQLSLDFVDNPVAAEGRVSARLKESERFTVAIGNPPYLREQQEVGYSGKRKGGVIRHGAAGIKPLLEDVAGPMKEAGLGRHVKNLYNLYVYFWRWAVWQTTELPPGPGIVAFITASSYLEGKSMSGLRYLLRDAFDEILIVDLGGEGRGALKEENVFDIQTPVAIAFGVRKGAIDSPCTVRYLRINGSRLQKLKRLCTLSLEDVEAEVSGEGFNPLVPVSDSEYRSWSPLTDLFPWSWSGSQIKRTWPIGPTRGVLRERWNKLIIDVPRQRGELLKETGSRTTLKSPKPLLGDGSPLRPIRTLDRGDQPEGIERYGYRSFDRQWVIADHRLMDAPKPVLWRIRSDRQLFLTTLTSTKLGRGPAVTVTPYVPDLDHFRGSYGAKNVMPIYRDRAARVPNLSAGLLETLSGEIDRPVTAEDLVAYVHALLGTAAFSKRFASELAEMAGPVRVPITSDPDLFGRAVELGRDLLWWHTWGERFAPDGNTNIPRGRAREVSPVEGYPNKFRYLPDEHLLEVGTGRFGPVSQEVWDFEVSGLKVVRKWLGYRMADRKGRKSSPLDDIRPRTWTFTDELLRLLAILEHTIEVTPAADDLLDKIISGPLIPPEDLPQPTDAERKPPKIPR